MIAKNNISMSVIRRLPRYYRYLSELEKKGIVRISSKELSEKMGFTASQIRQDFNCFGGFGQQGYGYAVSNLKETIGNILGVQNQRKCILIGAGNLGRALLSINYKHMGFDLCGVFDISPKVIGSEVRGYTVSDVKDLPEFCAEHKPTMAIICIPNVSVEEACDNLCELGIKAFWNFTHCDLSLKYDDVIIENVHLNDSLMTLSYMLSE